MATGLNRIPGERAYGEKYQEGLGLKEICKLMRADIKEAKKTGLLPDGKYSVRFETFSGGGAIRIEIKSLKDHPFCTPEYAEARREKQSDSIIPYRARYTETALKAVGFLEQLHGAYNHDGSETMTDYFDVNYYGGVEISYEAIEEEAPWGVNS